MRDQYEGREFFSPENTEFTINGKTIFLETDDKKIAFLQQMKDAGVDFSFKAFLDQMEHRLGWFKDFYSDWEIIKLTRSDRFSHFMSYIMHTESFTSLLELEMEEGKTSFIEDFLQYTYKLDQISFHDHHLIYEELDDDILTSFFGMEQSIGLEGTAKFRDRITGMKSNRDYRVEFRHYDQLKDVFLNTMARMEESQ